MEKLALGDSTCIQAHVVQMSLNVNSWQIVKFDGNTAENSDDNNYDDDKDGYIGALEY